MRNLMFLVGAVLVIAGCGTEEKSERGIKYMPEMYNTPAYKSQTAMERIDADGKTVRHIPMMLSPPAGTISRSASPYQIETLDFESAKQLVNPLLPDAQTLKVGQRWFNITCATCHGRDGNAANGYVAPSKAFPNRFSGIPSINGPNVERLSDGEIFHIITAGRVRMPNLHAQLPVYERWAVVHYLRALSRSALALGDAEKQLAQMEAALAAGGDKAAAIKPNDLALQRHLVKQKQHDLTLIQAGDDGAAFAPAEPARAEFEPLTWPEQK